MLLEILKVRKKLCNSYFVLVIYRSSLIYFLASVLEDKTSTTLSPTPQQTELTDMRQPPSVIASDNVKDEASKRSRTNDEASKRSRTIDEIDSDDTPDLKREYAKADCFFFLSLY